MRRCLIAKAVLYLFLLWPEESAAQSVSLDLTGGPVWENRVGLGIMAAFDGNDCTDNYCDGHLDTNFLGSIGGTIGAFYRVIPNFVALAEMHFGLLNTNAPTLNKDRGFLFQATAAGEFHGPINGWFDTSVGFGLGFAYLGAKGKNATTKAPHRESLRGVNFEFRTGVDIYPFSALPNFCTGPFFRLGLPYWTKACIEEDGDERCGEPDDFDEMKNLPFLVHFGLAFKYGF